MPSRTDRQSRRLRGWTTRLAALVLLVGGGVFTNALPASADALTPKLEQHLPMVAQHLARGGAIELPAVGCGTRCLEWFAGEQADAGPELNKELLGLRGTVGVLPLLDRFHGSPHQATLIGWKMGSGADAKWIGLPKPEGGPGGSIQSAMRKREVVLGSALYESIDAPDWGWMIMPLPRQVYMTPPPYGCGYGGSPALLPGYTKIESPPYAWCDDRVTAVDRVFFRPLDHPVPGQPPLGPIRDFDGQPVDKSTDSWNPQPDTFAQLQAGVRRALETGDYPAVVDWYEYLIDHGSPSPVPADRDDDGHPDGTDNCPDDSNPSQSDADDDGLGDACDEDAGARLAATFRPRLLFDSEEMWRPLDVDRFLGERRYDICASGCRPLQGVEDLKPTDPADSFLRLPGATSPFDYQGPNGARDQDSGPASSIYYSARLAENRPAPYHLFEYWFFYRYNHFDFFGADVGNHEADWEHMGIAVHEARPDRLAYAWFGAHEGQDHAYLPENLRCDGGDEGSCTGGRRPHVYVATGSHASYERPCDHERRYVPDVPCHQTGDWKPENDHDGNAPWGNNDDVSALKAFSPWSDWPGHWGTEVWNGTTAAHSRVQSPGPRLFSKAPGGPPAPARSGVARASARAATVGDSDCLTWFGPSVAIVCDADALASALRDGRLEEAGSFGLQGPEQGQSAATAPGLAQLASDPLTPGQALTIKGTAPPTAQLLVRAATPDGELLEATFRDLGLRTEGTATVRASSFQGRPMLALTRPDGSTVAPDETTLSPLPQPIASTPPGSAPPGSTPPPNRNPPSNRGPGPRAQTDAVRPVVSLLLGVRRSLGSLSRKGLAFRVRVSEAAKVVARLDVSRPLARRLGLVRGAPAKGGTPVAIGRSSTSLAAPGTKRIRIKLSTRTKRRLRAGQKLTTTLRLTVTDLAGNTTRQSRQIRFHR